MGLAGFGVSGLELLLTLIEPIEMGNMQDQHTSVIGFKNRPLHVSAWASLTKMNRIRRSLNIINLLQLEFIDPHFAFTDTDNSRNLSDTEALQEVTFLVEIKGSLMDLHQLMG